MRSNFRKPISIRQRLSLFTCALLLSVILVFGLICYIGVRQGALKEGQKRVQGLVNDLSTMLTGNTRAFVGTSFAAANQPAIKAYLLSKGKDSTEKVLKLLDELRKDTSYVLAELKNSDGKSMLKSVKRGIDININIDSLLLKLSKATKPDSGEVGKLYAINSFVYYPIITTVVDNNKAAGYLIRWRKMTATAKALEQFSQLLGTDARLFIGNADGTAWTNIQEAVTMPVGLHRERGVVEYSNDTDNILAGVRPITNSQWVVAIELSKEKILQAANHFLYWLVIAGLIIIIVGMSLAWLISKRVSDPLQRLTTAASTIAAGNHSIPVQVNRRDELGKLARAFNAMQVQVQNSQQALEEKAEEYRLLFESNPMPMWIIDRSTLNIIDVNKAAIEHYGYSRDEFLQLTAIDLRPVEEMEKYMEFTRQKIGYQSYAGLWKHKKKTGELITVEIFADDLMYHGYDARFILANDVTAKLKTEAELIKNRVMQQKLITETTIQVQEKEREEIGKELHDNINQILAAAKMHLELGIRGMENAEPFIKSSQHINLAIQEIRQLSQTLVAPQLGNISLKDALHELIHDMSNASSIKIKLNTLTHTEEKIDNDIKLMFYRVVQEQLNNIIKHAHAKNVIIELSTASNNTILVMQDDGVGFDTTVVRKGIGLRNITNRAKFYNGSATITSSPGNGTRLEVKIPFKVEESIAY